MIIGYCSCFCDDDGDGDGGKLLFVSILLFHNNFE